MIQQHDNGTMPYAIMIWISMEHGQNVVQHYSDLHVSGLFTKHALEHKHCCPQRNIDSLPRPDSPDSTPVDRRCSTRLALRTWPPVKQKALECVRLCFQELMAFGAQRDQPCSQRYFRDYFPPPFCVSKPLLLRTKGVRSSYRYTTDQNHHHSLPTYYLLVNCYRAMETRIFEWPFSLDM